MIKRRFLFFHWTCLNLISSWQFLTVWKLNPYHIPVDHTFQWGREARREGRSAVWMFCLLFYFILVETPTVLSLNSTDLYDCVTQRAVQNQPLTRGTWFDWMASGRKAAPTLCITHPFQLPPKRICAIFPWSALWQELSSVSLGSLTLVLPGNLRGSVSGSAAGSFELALSSINLWKEVSVQDKTSLVLIAFKIFAEDIPACTPQKS